MWAWLLGHYALAEYRVTGDAAAAQRRLEPIADHLADGGLGTISEILDGGVPHRPRGAPAQAWSVACTLDAWWQLERAKHLRASELATATLPSGTYCGPSGFNEMRGAPKVVGASSLARDVDAQRRLWEVSEEAVGLAWP